MASLDSEPGGWQYLHETAWLEGRCAAYIWLSGSVALVTTKRDLGRYDVNGTVLWRPERDDGTYWPPKRVFPPGSERVYVRNEGMRACTAELQHDEEKEVYCPHLNAARDERDGRSPASVQLSWVVLLTISTAATAGATILMQSSGRRLGILRMAR